MTQTARATFYTGNLHFGIDLLASEVELLLDNLDNGRKFVVNGAVGADGKQQRVFVDSTKVIACVIDIMHKGADVTPFSRPNLTTAKSLTCATCNHYAGMHDGGVCMAPDCDCELFTISVKKPT